MRNLLTAPVARLRVTGRSVLDRFGSNGDATCGCFRIPAGATAGGYRASAAIFCIAASMEGWDHVSASCKARCPNWGEMSLVHRLFFRDAEVAMQLHMPPSDHVNVHPFTLHLWRPQDGFIPLPPKEFV